MAAADRHWRGASPGDRHRGGEHGDRRLAASMLRRCRGDVAAVCARLRADAADPPDRARVAGKDAAAGYVARRHRVVAAFRQGAYRPCSACRVAVAYAPATVCGECGR